jgi:predicted permease
VETKSGRTVNMSYPDFLDYRDRAGVFGELAAMDRVQFAISSGGSPERVDGQIVSANYFAVLRTPMALGRGFLAEEERDFGAHPVAVIGFDLWQRRFAGDAGVLGKTIVVNGAPFTIVGVASERFNGVDHAERRDIWVPIAMASRAYPQSPNILSRRNSWFLTAIGRLAPGVSDEQASAATATVAARIAAADTVHQGLTARVFAMRGGLPPGDGKDIYPVAGLSAFVTALILLIACANVSNLLLGRAVARRREMGVRLSLGASRGRLVRQLLTESVLLALIATAAGSLLATWGTDLLASQIPAPIDVAPDRKIFLFAVAAALVTGMLFGFFPALDATRSDLATVLKEGRVGLDTRRSRLQSSLVVAQISASLVLLVTAGMFLRGLYKSSRLDFGFETSSRVLAASFDLGRQGYTPQRADAFIRALGERAASLPGVERVSFTNQVPMGERVIAANVAFESDKPREEAARDPRSAMLSYQYTVRPGYFATVGIAVLRGRDFTAADAVGAPDVVVVSEQLAQRAWPNEDPLGKRLSVGGSAGGVATVVGVAREALVAGRTERSRPVIYQPQLQHPATTDLTLLVRARCGSTRETCSAGELAAGVRREIAALDRDLPVYGVQTLAQYRSDRSAESRLGSGLLALFGSLALVLASVGVYAVTAFAVSQRTREIGVRVALGALQRQVVGLFVREGMRVAMIGVWIGLALSLVVAKLLSAVFLGLSVSDLPTVTGIVGLLAGVVLAASWIPARRAASVDPMEALRSE